MYVDFDQASGHFLSPSQQISSFDASARMVTLCYLCATADAIRRALLADDDSFRLTAFSEIAFRICSEELYQQDMPRLIEEFRKRTPRHEAVIADLEIALAGNVAFFEEIQKARGK